MLKDFRRWIVQEEINCTEAFKKSSDKRQSRKDSESVFTIGWIEKVLETPIEDHRNYCLWDILVPYLLNVKHLLEEVTFNIVRNWLEKCDKIRKQIFEPKTNIYSTIKGNKGGSNRFHIQNSGLKNHSVGFSTLNYYNS